MKIIKKTFFFLSIAIAFVGCDSPMEMNGEEINYLSIIGKWKLIKTVHPMSGQSLDYSKYNIFYEFKSDNILKISGDSGEQIFFDTGEHFYTFVEDEMGYGMVGLPYGLKIDNNTFWYNLSSKELIIDNSPLDGGKIYFILIN